MPTAFTKKLVGKPVARDGYGPGKKGVTYRCLAKNGVTYEVSRHRWTLPTTHWAWKAEPHENIATGQKLSPHKHYRIEPSGTLTETDQRTKGTDIVHTVYADTLDDLARELGYDWEEIEPGSTV